MCIAYTIRHSLTLVDEKYSFIHQIVLFKVSFLQFQYFFALWGAEDE
jgi:hypothetical protein